MFNGGPHSELDELWEKLGDGGEFFRCGWLKDRVGLCWQIVPVVLRDDPDAEAFERVMNAMLGIIKLDIVELDRAQRGTTDAPVS